MAHKRRTSSVLVESVEYSVNTTTFFNPAVTVCVLAGDVSIALSPVVSRSTQRETISESCPAVTRAAARISMSQRPQRAVRVAFASV